MDYIYSYSMVSKYIKGKISINSFGTGYVSSEEIEDDIKIETSLLKTALHNDKVEVLLLPKKKNEKQQGEVVRILERFKMLFVGTIEKKKNEKYAFLIADNKRMYTDIFLPNCNIKANKKVLVEITNWSDSKKNPEGKVISIIGDKGDNDTEIRAIALEKGFDFKFSKKLENDANELKKKKIDLKGRLDFRNKATFTIDPKDAKDFDDALSVEKVIDGLYEIGIHIADVSHYVKRNTELDKEARKRAFSIYLVDRTIPMLPEAISNDVCSLNPEEEKLTLSAVFKIKESGEITDCVVAESVIFSRKRFDYKEAEEVLKNKTGPFYNELSVLEKITKNLIKKREERGALNIEDDELGFVLDNDGRPISVYKKEHLFTHRIVEEFMILANKYIAEKFNTLYRVHEKPDKKMIDKLITFLVNMGYRGDYVKGKDVTTKELNNLLADIKGDDKEFLVKKSVLRSMSKAEYSTKNKKHFGLALEKYTHFTSPIRRYADYLVHCIIKESLAGEKISAREYEQVARDISLRELDVLEAERNSVQYKQIEYMKDKVGEDFEVIISGVTSFGIFVQEMEIRVEGMISVRAMEDDYYILDEENYCLLGTRTRKKYSLGDKLKVKLIGCSLEAREINFKIL